MKTAFILLFSISILFLLGALYYLSLFQKSGAYPPKQILIKRIRFLGGSGGAFLLMGFLFYFLN